MENNEKKAKVVFYSMGDFAGAVCQEINNSFKSANERINVYIRKDSGAVKKAIEKNEKSGKYTDDLKKYGQNEPTEVTFFPHLLKDLGGKRTKQQASNFKNTFLYGNLEQALKDTDKNGYIILGANSSGLKPSIDEIKKLAEQKKDMPKKIVIVAKGLIQKDEDIDTAYEYIKKNLKGFQVATIGGANFSGGMYDKMDTATTIGVEDPNDPTISPNEKKNRQDFIQGLKNLLEGNKFSVKVAKGAVNEVNFLGLIKNVSAILFGAFDGMAEGDKYANTIAKLKEQILTSETKKIFTEYKKFFKGNATNDELRKIAFSPAGLQDFYACTSTSVTKEKYKFGDVEKTILVPYYPSRNMRLGAFMISKDPYKLVDFVNSNSTIEGAKNAMALSKIEKQLGIKNGIASQVMPIVENFNKVKNKIEKYKQDKKITSLSEENKKEISNDSTFFNEIFDNMTKIINNSNHNIIAEINPSIKEKRKLDTNIKNIKKNINKLYKLDDESEKNVRKNKFLNKYFDIVKEEKERELSEYKKPRTNVENSYKKNQNVKYNTPVETKNKQVEDFIKNLRNKAKDYSDRLAKRKNKNMSIY